MTAIRFESSGVRITDDAIEARGKTYPLGEVGALEEVGFWGARVAFAASALVMAMFALALGDSALGRNWIYFAFLVTWAALVVMLGYAALALKSVRMRMAGRGVTLPGRFTRDERRRMLEAFATAKGD